MVTLSARTAAVELSLRRFILCQLRDLSGGIQQETYDLEKTCVYVLVMLSAH